ncbi:hypothetical protein BC831DRAFT_549337 [Entophlyctis helioformis]|nr:hypothetical protein BC831DRAFT_549337 [Entophlyctis helioformis]
MPFIGLCATAADCRPCLCSIDRSPRPVPDGWPAARWIQRPDRRLHGCTATRLHGNSSNGKRAPWLGCVCRDHPYRQQSLLADHPSVRPTISLPISMASLADRLTESDVPDLSAAGDSPVRLFGLPAPATHSSVTSNAVDDYSDSTSHVQHTQEAARLMDIMRRQSAGNSTQTATSVTSVTSPSTAGPRRPTSPHGLPLSLPRPPLAAPTLLSAISSASSSPTPSLSSASSRLPLPRPGSASATPSASASVSASAHSQQAATTTATSRTASASARSTTATTATTMTTTTGTSQSMASGMSSGMSRATQSSESLPSVSTITSTATTTSAATTSSSATQSSAASSSMATSTSVSVSEDLGSELSSSASNASVATPAHRHRQSSGSNNVRFSLPQQGPSQPAYSREALHRQIQLLELSKQELIASSDARAHTYQVKIKALNSVVDSLQHQLADAHTSIAEKSAQIEQLHELIQARSSASLLQTGSASWTESSIANEGWTAKLNMDMLRENAGLRDENRAMHEQLQQLRQLYIEQQNRQQQQQQQQQQQHDSDHTNSSDPVLLNGEIAAARTSAKASATAVLHEVERILHNSGHAAANTEPTSNHAAPPRPAPATFSAWPSQSIVLTAMRSTQTDVTGGDVQDPFNPSTDQTVRICELMGERDHLLKALQVSESRSQSLLATLDQLRAETTDLEAHYTTLLSETQVALDAERLSRETISDQRETIQRYSDQVLELAKQIDAYRDQVDRLVDEHRQYKSAQSVLHHMSQVHVHHLRASLRDAEAQGGGHGANGDGADGGEGAEPSADPMMVLQLQWVADRERYAGEIEMLQRTIQGLERELEYQRGEAETRMAGMHDEQEWALMLAKYTIAKDEAQRAQDELKMRTSIIETLQEKMTVMETTIETQRKDVKTAKDRMAKLKEDQAKREEAHKQTAVKMEKYEAALKQVESKIKNASTLLHHKEATIKDLKTKLEAAQSTAKSVNPPAASEAAVEGVQVAVKAVRMDLARKTALSKHWRAKVEALEKELVTLKSATQSLIDPKMLATIQGHLKATRRRAKETESFVARYSARDAQYMSAIERFVRYICETLPVLDVDLFGSLGVGGLGGQGGAGDGVGVSGVDRDEVMLTAQELSKRILNIDLESVLHASTRSVGSDDHIERLHSILGHDGFEDALFQMLVDMYMMAR